jgi:hypothetical protein
MTVSAATRADNFAAFRHAADLFAKEDFAMTAPQCFAVSGFSVPRRAATPQDSGAGTGG